MGIFRRGQPPEALSAAMAGVKLGDRVLFAGTDDVQLVTELAGRAGLSGRVVSLAGDAAAAAARVRRIEDAGAFAEPAHAALDALPFDAGSFDVVVAEETLLARADIERRAALAEIFRVVRPGGRLLWIEREPRGGLFKPASGSPDVHGTAVRERMLSDAGFRGVRTLAAVEGRTYVEGIKSAAAQ